jgi:predicted transcriptional regulator
VGTELKRKKLVNRIVNTIEAASAQKLGISKKKLMAQICVGEGLTTRKAGEYFQMLIDAELIRDDDGVLWAANHKHEQPSV